MVGLGNCGCSPPPVQSRNVQRQDLERPNGAPTPNRRQVLQCAPQPHGAITWSTPTAARSCPLPGSGERTHECAARSHILAHLPERVGAAMNGSCGPHWPGDMGVLERNLRPGSGVDRECSDLGAVRSATRHRRPSQDVRLRSIGGASVFGPAVGREESAGRLGCAAPVESVVGLDAGSAAGNDAEQVVCGAGDFGLA